MKKEMESKEEFFNAIKNEIKRMFGVDGESEIIDSYSENIYAITKDYADQDRWISVDKPPEKLKNVLVITNRGQYGISCVDATGKMDEYICEVNQTDSEEDEKIIGWQPLPKPPQQ